MTFHVYTGADGAFLYYTDSGDGYAYENGEYEVHELHYSEAEKQLLPCELLTRENITVRYI